MTAASRRLVPCALHPFLVQQGTALLRGNNLHEIGSVRRKSLGIGHNLGNWGPAGANLSAALREHGLIIAVGSRLKRRTVFRPASIQAVVAAAELQSAVSASVDCASPHRHASVLSMLNSADQQHFHMCSNVSASIQPRPRGNVQLLQAIHSSPSACGHGVDRAPADAGCKGACASIAIVVYTSQLTYTQAHDHSRRYVRAFLFTSPCQTRCQVVQAIPTPLQSSLQSATARA